VSKAFYGFNAQYDIIDLEGNLVKSFKIEKFKKSQYAYRLSTFIQPIKNRGFLKFGPDLAGEDQVVEFLDNEGKIKYRIKPKTIAKTKGDPIDEQLSYALSTDSLLVLQAGGDYLDHRTLSNRTDGDLRIYKLSTGEEIGFIQIIHKEGRLIPIDVAHRKDGFTVYGKYFETEDTREGYNAKELKGIYMQRFNLKGEMITEVMHPISEIADLEDPEGNKIIREGQGIWIQSNLEVANGHSFMICEKYDRGSKEDKGYNTSLYIGDFVVVEFDENFSTVGVKQFAKERTKYTYFNLKLVSDYEAGKWAETSDWYDYQYASINNARSAFTAIYTSYDHDRKRPDEKYTIGAIAYNQDGELLNPKISLDNFPKNVAFIPAKTGYVALFEFDDENENLSLTLYKFDM
jgi:hypothetical protein